MGNVLRDQFAFMARCGFDTIEAQKPEDAVEWSAALGEISVSYQPASATRQPPSAPRRRAAAGKNCSSISNRTRPSVA